MWWRPTAREIAFILFAAALAARGVYRESDHRESDHRVRGDERHE
jgi:hypothetical protein